MVPENKIQEFVSRARESAGANIQAIILFGSAASGDFHPGISDVNLFCVLQDTSFTALQKLAPVVAWWRGEKQPPPLCMTRHELERSTDVFAIELLDMAQHHRVVFGEDVLQNLRIPMNLHRVQVEYEFREKLVLLRQHLLLADGNDSRLWDVVMQSAPSFATLFRHALIVIAGDAPSGRKEAAAELAKRLGFDASPIEQALEVHARILNPKNLNAKDFCARYLSAIEKVTAAVDEALDSETNAQR